jgi:hypothetical protein
LLVCVHYRNDVFNCWRFIYELQFYLNTICLIKYLMTFRREITSILIRALSLSLSLSLSKFSTIRDFIISTREITTKRRLHTGCVWNCDFIDKMCDFKLNRKKWIVWELHFLKIAIWKMQKIVFFFPGKMVLFLKTQHFKD